VPQQEHGEKVLHELGLTSSQAKIYLYLVRCNDNTTVNVLSDISNIVRQDVYRILEELQEIGLVEKTLSTPNEFKAISIKEATSILIERRSEKTLALVKESAMLAEMFHKTDFIKIRPESQQFVLLPKGEMLIRRIEKAIKAAHKNILLITPWKEFVQWIYDLNEVWHQAAEKDVTVFWIITEETPKTSDPNLQMISEFLNNPKFKIRSLLKPNKERIGIYDSNEVFIATTKSTEAGKSPALWTNNPVVICILEDYFQINWNEAAKLDIPSL
jgi:sugar-specific transcriptional regulator TrmB